MFTISEINLKQKLLESNYAKDNEYLSKYVELISNNINTPEEKHKTQKHHAIPVHYFEHRNLQLDNSKANLINLKFQDHVRAHYYLYRCVLNEEEIFSNLYCLRRMLGRKYEELLKYENLNDQELAQMYEKYSRYNSLFHTGKTHSTSEETKKKIGEANRGKYKDYISIHNSLDEELRIPQSDLNYYLSDGWMVGRSLHSKQSLSNSYNYNSKGMLGKSQSEFQKEQARKAQIGKSKSLEARKKMSEGHAGKRLYTNPVTGRSLYIKESEIEEYESLGYIKYKRPKRV